MSFDANTFLAKALGEDFLETLSKTDLYKPNANVVIDPEDIRIGLKVVPRTIMSLLIRELVPMKMGDVKAIPLFLGENAVMNVNKHDSDTYSGTIIDHGAVIVSFKYRPLPGVGLVIMSCFELYSVEEEQSDKFIPDAEQNVQKLIDERLALRDLVGQVVENKMMEREAIQRLFMSKLKEMMAAQKTSLNESSMSAAPKGDIAAEINENSPQMVEPTPKGIDIPVNKPQDHSHLMEEALAMSEKTPKKGSPLKGFLEKKAKKNDFKFKLMKGEQISCPDCLKNIFDGSVYSGCICLGSDFERKVFIKKSEDNQYNIRFSKGWDKENIELLLEVLRRKNG